MAMRYKANESFGDQSAGVVYRQRTGLDPGSSGRPGHCAHHQCQHEPSLRCQRVPSRRPREGSFRARGDRERLRNPARLATDALAAIRSACRGAVMDRAGRLPQGTLDRQLLRPDPVAPTVSGSTTPRSRGPSRARLARPFLVLVEASDLVRADRIHVVHVSPGEGLAAKGAIEWTTAW